MNFKNFQLSTLDHHAYYLEGDFEFIKEELLKALEKFGFKTKANPDFLYIVHDSFGIDDAHKISAFQSKKAIVSERKVIVIETKSLTREAQNSLLKTFEEPTPNTHFFLIVPSSEILLPTLKSRMLIAPMSNMGGSLVSDMGVKFLKVSKKERLEIIKKIAEEKDKLGAINLLNQIERAIYEKDGGVKKERVELLETTNKFRSYLNDRSPNLKMILEHIALITPNQVGEM